MKHKRAAPATAALSFRGFAKRHGVTEKAVRNAIQSGRLRHCLRKNAKGQTLIVDLVVADREWKAGAGQRSPQPRGAAPAAAHAGPTLIDVQRRVIQERTRKLRLDNDRTRGRLVDVATVAKEAFEAERTIRESLLNIPARVSAELAAETDAGRVHLRLDAAIREALTMTADALLATVNG